MVFSVDNYSFPKEVTVYESINQLVNMVEWQDVLDKGVTIIDSEGKIYEWDDAKNEEYATVYEYSMRVAGTNTDLADKCVRAYEALDNLSEFLLDKQLSKEL